MVLQKVANSGERNGNGKVVWSLGFFVFCFFFVSIPISRMRETRNVVSVRRRRITLEALQVIGLTYNTLLSIYLTVVKLTNKPIA